MHFLPAHFAVNARSILKKSSKSPHRARTVGAAEEIVNPASARNFSIDQFRALSATKSRTVLSSETEITFSFVRHQNALEEPPSRFRARETLSGESDVTSSASA